MKSDKLIYSGKIFKTFLERKKLSHKTVAAQLGINKNTVGKAARGGNLNVNILLLICNEYDLKISDFFTTQEKSDKKRTDNQTEKTSLKKPQCEQCQHCSYRCLEDSEIMDLLLQNIAMLIKIRNDKSYDGLLEKLREVL